MAAAQGKKQLKQIIDPRLAKAFTHPLRGHVWVTICERGVASPSEIAEETGLDVSEVSYHFRHLKKSKLIKLLRTEKRRGFAEHFYVPTTPVLYFSFDDRSRHLSGAILVSIAQAALETVSETALSRD